MNEVTTINGIAVTGSRDVAKAFGKSHKHVLDSARKLKLQIESDGQIFGHEIFFESEYTTERGKTYKQVLMTRDGFSLLAMGFTGEKALKWKLTFIRLFNEMEGYAKKDAESLNDKINEVSGKIDDLAIAGSSWGKTGSEIRKHKRQAIERLDELLDQAQLKLGFER